MRPYSVEVKKRGGAFQVGLIQPPEGVRLIPVRWGDSDRWGFADATIEATGPEEGLEQLLTWVGDWLQIRNEWGSVVWNGRIHEVELALGGSTLVVNLDDVYNRVRVAYSYRTPQGGEASGITAWAENADSLAQFGPRELQMSLPDAGTALPYAQTAIAVRDSTLRRMAWPAPVLLAGSDAMRGATLVCRSHLDDLDVRYYVNPNGLVEYVEPGDEEQPLYATVSGTDISFEAPSTIKRTAGGFINLKSGDTLFVQGAANAANNGLFTVAADPATAGTLLVTASTLVTAAAGPSISITQGGPQAHRIAQSFQLPAGASPWDAKRIAVRLRRYDPNAVGIAGHISVELCADSSGAPGTVLDSVALTGGQTNALPARTSWVEFVLAAGTATLNPSTTYWVVVKQSAAVFLGRHIAAAVDTDKGFSGNGRIYNGSAWVARDPDFHMPIRVTGALDSVTLTQDTLKQSAAVVSTMQRASGRQVWQYRDGERTARDEANELLDMESENDRPLFVQWRVLPWNTTPSGTVEIVERPTVDLATMPILRRNGQLEWPNGEPWEPGRLVAGMWVELDATPALTGMTTRRRALWIERSEYDARSDRLSLETAGARDPLAGLGVRRG